MSPTPPTLSSGPNTTPGATVGGGGGGGGGGESDTGEMTDVAEVGIDVSIGTFTAVDDVVAEPALEHEVARAAAENNAVRNSLRRIGAA